MVYVRRSDSGQIVAVSLEKGDGCEEPLEHDAPELVAFSQALTGDSEALAFSDLGLVRVLEDLVNLLIARGVIRFTDFPEVAQEKLLERRSIREGIHGLKLLGDEQSKFL